MERIFNPQQGYTYKDISIIPKKVSEINHRSECNPFYVNNYSSKFFPLFTAPMASVINDLNYNIFYENHINPIIPRSVAFETRKKILYAEPKVFIAVSLGEFSSLISFEQENILNCKTHVKICIDIANGHMQTVLESIKTAKQKFGDKLIIMAGNIANPETYLEYCKAGVDFVRCSIGTGNCCITASNCGIFYPPATLIAKCNEYKEKWESENRTPATKIIADGGMHNFDDIIKALALGADYVMCGSLFAGFYESAAKIINKSAEKGVPDYLVTISDEKFKPEFIEKFKREFIKNNKLEKEVFGMSTKKAQEIIAENNHSGEFIHYKTSEGIEKTIPVKYTIKQWVENFKSYLTSAMSYCNAKTLNDFIGQQDFIVLSPGVFETVNK